MSQQDKKFEKLFVDKFSKFSKADSDLKWRMMIEAFIEINKAETIADNLEAQLKSKDEVIQGLIEDLEDCEKHCICERNTYGFDYHEKHKKLGMPRIGSRWLTPTEIARKALAWAKEKMNTNTNTNTNTKEKKDV